MVFVLTRASARESTTAGGVFPGAKKKPVKRILHAYVLLLFEMFLKIVLRSEGTPRWCCLFCGTSFCTLDGSLFLFKGICGLSQQNS
jgi:hypothetical protein